MTESNFWAIMFVTSILLNIYTANEFLKTDGE